MTTRFLILLMTLLATSHAAMAQTTIALFGTSRVEPGAPVLVSDIASVAGDDADAVKAIAIAAKPEDKDPATSGSFDLSIDDIKAALTAGGAKLGRIAIRGSSCRVRYTDAQRPQAKPQKKDAARATPSYTSVELAGPTTVKTMVAASLARFHSVSSADIRFSFDPKDDELLSLAAAGRRVDIQPAASSDSQRVPVRVYIFSGERLLRSGTVSVGVQVRRTILTAAIPIERRQAIAAEHITLADQWIDPGSAASCTLEQAIGATARNRIIVGQAITPKLVESPVIVKKGDILQVHCLSGSVHLKASRARALGNAREGETVEIMLEGGRKRFVGRVTGRGQAVVSLDDAGAAPSVPAPESTNVPQAEIKE